MTKRWKEDPIFEAEITFPLVGPAGEDVDLWRTLTSHGMSSLPPMSIDEEARTMDITIPIDGRLPRRIRIQEGPSGLGAIKVFGRQPGRETKAKILAKVRYILRLDERGQDNLHDELCLVRHRADGGRIM
jgi:hypothetical protein